MNILSSVEQIYVPQAHFLRGVHGKIPMRASISSEIINFSMEPVVSVKALT
jgi:hypothetical protein